MSYTDSHAIADAFRTCAVTSAREPTVMKKPAHKLAKTPAPKKGRLGRDIPKNPMDALSEEDAQFVEEYLIDFNEYRAAQRCGYPRLNARSVGQLFMHRPEIVRAITHRVGTIDQKHILNPSRIIAELAKVAYGDGAFVGGKLIALQELSKIAELGPKKDGNKPKAKGGVMLVPGVQSLEQWEAAAKNSQAKLKEQVRE